MKIIVTDNYESMSKDAALQVIDMINKKTNCVLGLATGSTPIGMYKKLIEYFREEKVDFSQVTTFNLDEYYGISGENINSYRYFMNRNLFNFINIKKKNTFIPNGLTKDINLECKRYDKIIEDIGGIDLQILGIGANGHIGFNEPSKFLDICTHITELKSETIKDNSKLFNSKEEVPEKAITMGMKNIMNSKKIILLASGQNKANIIKRLVNNEYIDTELPASILHIHKDCTIILDMESAKYI